MPLIVWWVVGGGWGVFLRNIEKLVFFFLIKNTTNIIRNRDMDLIELSVYAINTHTTFIFV